MEFKKSAGSMTRGGTGADDMAEPAITTNRDQRRAQILDVAAALFARRGFGKATLSDVARTVGLGATAMYYYYTSKKAMLFACIERTMVRLNDSLAASQSGQSDTTPAQRLRALVAAQVHVELAEAETMPMINNYLYGALRESAHFEAEQIERLRSLQRETVEFYRRILREGVESGDFTSPHEAPTAFAILGMVQYVSAWYRPGARLSVDQIAEMHADLVLRMVTGQSEAIGL
jgi:AcrR family transcriptional regulator